MAAFLYYGVPADGMRLLSLPRYVLSVIRSDTRFTANPLFIFCDECAAPLDEDGHCSSPDMCDLPF